MNKMKKPEYSEALVRWVRDLITERYEAEKAAYQTFESYLISNFYLVTLVFNQSKILQKYKDEDQEYAIGEIELKQFRHLYNLVCREALGRKYNKASNAEKPLSISCIDANGSRYWSEVGELDNIHIHSVWLMNPSMKGCFDKVVKNMIEKPTGAIDIENVDVKRYTGELDKIISYTMKFDAFTRDGDDIGVTFHILPAPV
ncbi:hypothetical protein [Shinella zoogloeoides]|uniref:hypothetical protein n=1 Tax=Shinella zoogloeoides TaxID=352475 RepID=UPI001F56ED79|nr:hypothetical protein [Shinella zoogloeoides]